MKHCFILLLLLSPFTQASDDVMSIIANVDMKLDQEQLNIVNNDESGRDQIAFAAILNKNSQRYFKIESNGFICGFGSDYVRRVIHRAPYVYSFVNSHQSWSMLSGGLKTLTNWGVTL